MLLTGSNRWTRSFVAVVTALAGLGVASTAVAEDLKVGYVDLNRALAETEKGQEVKKKLQQDFKDRQEKLNGKQREIKKLKKKLSSQSKALSKEARRKRQQKLRRKLGKLQQLYMREQRAMSKKKAKETKDIFAKMRTIVEGIAEEKGYDLVLEKSKSSVLYAEKRMDLTDALIEKFDEKYGDESEGD